MTPNCYKKKEDNRWVYTIANPHPPEIDAFERRPFDFFVTEPSCGPNSETIPVLCLPGRGFLNRSDYMKSVHQSLSSKRNVLVITVDYLGIHVPSNEFRNYNIDDWCVEQMLLRLKKDNLPAPPITDVNNPDFISTLFAHMNQLPQHLNTNDDPFITMLTSTQGEHADFGLIQVIDCLWAIAILKQEYPNIRWNALTASGLSHGAYLALQCDRFAPNTFALILSCFGWTGPVDSDLFREINYTFGVLNGVKSKCFIENYWRQEPNHPWALNPDRRTIRDQTNFSQLQQWREYQKTRQSHKVMIHQINDSRHPVALKNEMAEQMKNLGFEFEYYRNNEEAPMPYRSIAQGAETSVKGFVFDFLTPERLNHSPATECDFSKKHSITYHCQNSDYTFDYSSGYPIVTVKHHHKP